MHKNHRVGLLGASLAVSAIMGGTSMFGLIPPARTTREPMEENVPAKTVEDIMQIEKAQAKRDRKALLKQQQRGQ